MTRDPRVVFSEVPVAASQQFVRAYVDAHILEMGFLAVSTAYQKLLPTPRGR